MIRPCNKIIYEVLSSEKEAFRLIEWHCNIEDEHHIYREVNGQRLFSFPKGCIDQSKVHSGAYTNRHRAERERQILITKCIHEHKQQIAHSKKILHIMALAQKERENT